MIPILDFIHTNRDRYIDELKGYLAIPSVSALPRHHADVRRCGEWTADELRRVGLENVRLIETPGHPVVYGEWLHAPGAPTMLFYGHYDVQPVDPVELWESPPFEATVRDGEIYARGAADDKGQVFMHLKAIEAHLKKGGKLPVNIKVIIEGEEEVGSAHLDDFIRDHKADLAADVVVISDSAMFDRGVPSICYSLRGLLYFQIDLRGTSTDLHSGVFGGAVANPANVLARRAGADEGSRRPHQDSRVLRRGAAALGRRARRLEAAAVQREEVPQGHRRAEALRRDGVYGARARLGASDVRRQWPQRGFHRRRRQDRDSRRRDGEGQHAPRAGSGSRHDRRALSKTTCARSRRRRSS